MEFTVQLLAFAAWW